MMISRKGYYENYNILMEIIKQQKDGHETMFLPFQRDEDGKLKSSPPIRWGMCNYIDMLKRHWARYNFLETDMNLYHSLARYQMVMFSFSWRIKSQQQSIWMQEFKKYIIDYSCFIETDSPDIEKAHADSKDIKTFLDKYKIVYSPKFSGSKGFHFIIPAEEFAWLGWKVYDDVAEKNVRDFGQLVTGLPCGGDGGTGNIMLDKVLLFKIIALRLKTLLSCSTIDTSVQDIKRVCKTAYSWDVKSNLIAYPLDDEMFNNFRKNLVTPENVLTYNNYKRGLLWRNVDVPKEERARLCEKMLKDLGILK